MSATYGLEKLSHLEDKIYRTIEQFKRERNQREAIERELASVKRELVETRDEKVRLEAQTERLISERETIKHKVEGMLEAIAMLESEEE